MMGMDGCAGMDMDVDMDRDMDMDMDLHMDVIRYGKIRIGINGYGWIAWMCMDMHGYAWICIDTMDGD